MLAIIGGSGLTAYPELHICESVSRSTPYGEASVAVQLGELGGKPVAFLARHGQPHRIPPHKVNYRANLYLLQSLGVTEIIAVNAVGGIGEAYAAGVICVPDQIVDYTYGREHTFSDSAAVPLLHCDFTEPYSEPLRQRLLAAARTLNEPIVENGVYAAVQGPRLETAAEIRRLANDGCDLVGMTGMPEAGLARELALDYACLAVVANKAAGCSDEPITIEQIHRVMDAAQARVRALIRAVV